MDNSPFCKDCFDFEVLSTRSHLRSINGAARLTASTRMNSKIGILVHGLFAKDGVDAFSYLRPLVQTILFFNRMIVLAAQLKMLTPCYKRIGVWPRVATIYRDTLTKIVGHAWLSPAGQSVSRDSGTTLDPEPLLIWT